jgi:glyoxylase-like metal-dependent hydrolase (beta-lactamase superfamily II)
VLYQPLLVEAGAQLILVDAGAGPEAAAEWGDPVGLTLDSLRSLGADPGDIDTVVITHGHLDHVGGLTSLVDGARVPSFPNARHVVSRAEWDHWSDPTSGARLHLGTLDDAGLLDRSDGAVKIAEGVTTFETPGHTPGHVSVGVTSGGETAIVFGDVLMGDWNFDHVEWVSSPEVDPDQAVRTRRALLQRAADEHALIQAFHVDGIGKVEADGDAFRFVRRDAP